MKRFALVVVVIVCMFLVPALAEAANQVFVATPSADPVYGSPSTNPRGLSVEELSPYSVKSENKTASTTSAFAITTIPNRVRVEFWVNDSNDLWVAIGTTTAPVGATAALLAARGTVKISSSTPLKLDIGPYVPISYTASTATTFTVIQTGR